MMARNIRATLVGVNAYQDQRYARAALLKWAEADALAMALTIKQSRAFHIDSCEVYLDGQATYDNVFASLHRTFPSNLTFDSDTIALFYFAGHGVKHVIDDTICLCCQDVNFTNPYSGGIRLNQIYDLLLKSCAGCSIAIIDACYSGGIVDLKRIEHISPIEYARRGAVESLRGADDKTVAVFASSRSDQRSREDSLRGHGIYTYEILRGWRDGKASNERGEVSLFGLVDYLSQRFQEDRQAPRATVIGSLPVILGYAEPRSPDKLPEPPPIPIPKPLTYITPGTGLATAPAVTSKPPLPAIKSWGVPVLVGVSALLVCSLVTALVQPLHIILLVLAFGLGVLFAFSGFLFHRVIGAVMLLGQFSLLAGFAYGNFHWGVGASPVVTVPLIFLANLQWLFWIALALELIVLIGLILSALMR